MRYNSPMTADSEKDIQALKAIGRVCAETLRKKNEPIILTLSR